MDGTRQRRIRWAVRGALILAALAVVLGGLFTVLITLFAGDAPPGAGPGFWAPYLLLSLIPWAGGGLFFGALLGMYASMIWRDDTQL